MLRARVLTQAQLERALRRQAVRIAEQVSQQTYSSRHDCETIRPCRWEIGAQIDLFGAGQTAPWQTATRTHNGGSERAGGRWAGHRAHLIGGAWARARCFV